MTHIAKADQRMSLVVNGFVKHLQRGGISDDDITAALKWLRDMVDQVLAEPEPVAAPLVSDD